MFKWNGKLRFGIGLKRLSDFRSTAVAPHEPTVWQIGAGDLVSLLTKSVGIKQCAGCLQRAQRLNSAIHISRLR